jgi:hypothetical protein
MPNHKPTTKAAFHDLRRIVNPLQMDTVNASMERPMARKINSTIVMILP